MSFTLQDRSIRYWLPAMLVIGAACFLYVYRIGDKPLDFDERYSVNIALGTGGTPAHFSGFGQFTSEPIPGSIFHSSQFAARASLESVVRAAINDNGQGLPFFILLHYWFKAFGVSAITARMPSALLIIASLALLFALLRRLKISQPVALTAIALLAGNGVIIGLAQYARFYSLGIFLLVASLHVWLSLYRGVHSKGRIFLLGLLWALLFLTQYFAAFVIVPQAFFLLRKWRTQSFRKELAWLTAGVAMPVIVWLWPLHGWESLRNIYALHHRPWQAMLSMTTKSTPANLAVALASGFAGAFGQPVNFLKGNAAALLQIAPAAPAFLLAGIALYRLKNAPWIQLCACVLGIYATASLVHAIATGHTLLFQVRYWVFAYVFSYGLLAYAWTFYVAGAKQWKWLCAVVLALSFARVAYTSASEISGLTLTPHGQLQPIFMAPLEDYEAVAFEIKKAAQPGDTLSFRDWKTAQVVNWYLLDRAELVQRVDSAQAALVKLCQGGLRCDTVAIPRGRGLHARQIWSR